jgi:hypothetical protein
MLLVDRPVGPNDRGFDVAERRIDPFETGGTSCGSARASYDDLVGTSGLASEAPPRSISEARPCRNWCVPFVG